MRARSAHWPRSMSRGCSRSRSGWRRWCSRLIQSNSWGWGSPRIVGLFVLACRRAERVRRDRAAPARADGRLQLLRVRSFLGANIVAFIVSFAMLAMFFFLALYMQDILRLLPASDRPAVPAVDRPDHRSSGPIAGRLADRVGPRSLMTIGMLAVVLLAVLDDRDHDRLELLVPARQLRRRWAPAWAS